MRFIRLLCVLWLSACSVQEFDNARPVNAMESARSRVAIAAEYLQKGEQDKALRHLQRALEQNPRSAEAHNIMGVLMEREGDDRSAEEHYRKALDLREDYPQARNNYGVMLFRLQRYDESVKQLGLAAGNLAYDRREAAYENLGKAWLAAGDKVQAQQAFEKAIRLDSRLPVATLELAYMAFERNDPAAANLYFQRHLKVQAGQPASARSLWLGIVLARMRGDHDAQAGYEMSLKRLYPDSPEYRSWQNSQAQDR